VLASLELEASQLELKAVQKLLYQTEPLSVTIKGCTETTVVPQTEPLSVTIKGCTETTVVPQTEPLSVTIKGSTETTV